MQNTSALYKEILSVDGHWFESKLVIDDVGTFDSSTLFSIYTAKKAVDGKPEIGRAIAAEIDLRMLKPSESIPKMATLRLYVRAHDASRVSGWIPKGVFFIDTRKATKNGNGFEVLTIHGYDFMLKAEQDYPDTDHDWPYADISVVEEIAATIGVGIDARTRGLLTSRYMIDLPPDHTMREVLEGIAAAYCGNFVITDENNLLFVPLYGLDPEANGSYLADENGNALTFGNEGWFILV